MAGYRQFHTKFWKDEWLIDLEPLERYLFSYLFTNELSSISGLYKLPMRVIQNETGLDKQYIEATLQKFQDAKKIFYRGGVMWVVKMHAHHKNASPLTMKKVNADVDMVDDCDVKRAYQYYEITGEYCIDTVSIPIPIIKSESKKEDVVDNSPPNPQEWQPEEGIGSPLSAAFETASGILMHSPQKWIETIRQMEKLGIDDNDVKIAVSELRGKNYNIIGPWSVVNAAINVHGKRNGKANGAQNNRRRKPVEVD